MRKVATSQKCTIQIVAVYHGGEETHVTKITVHADHKLVVPAILRTIEANEWATGRQKRMSGGRRENGRRR